MASRGVLVLGNYPPPFGGVPRHIQLLAPALLDAGWRVHVVTGDLVSRQPRAGLHVHGFSRWERRRALGGDVRHVLARWQRLGTVPWADTRTAYTYLTLAALARRLAVSEDLSLIVAYNLYTFGPIGALISAELRLPLVLNSFGEFFKYPEFFSRHEAVAQFVVRQATRRLSMTAHCATAYRELTPGLDYEVVPYGIDVENFAGDANGGALRRRLGIPAEAPVLLYFGRMTRELGLEIFLAAARRLLDRLPNLHVLVAGKPEELLGLAREAEAEASGRLMVVPNVAPEEASSFYAASSVVAVPSLDARACGSLSAAEAAAVGRPVVAARVGGVPEFVQEGRTGLLVPPGDPEALAATVLRLCSDPAQAQRLGSAGRLFAETSLDYRQTNARMLEIFEQAWGAATTGSEAQS